MSDKPLGLKYDAGKPRMELLLDGMPDALLGIAEVLTFGAKKYADHSWQHVERGQARYSAALLRHQLAISKGETHDAESGLPHEYHVACCALFLAQLRATADQRAKCSERVAGAEPVQCASGPADDCRGDGELAGDERTLGGSAGRTTPVAEKPEGAVGNHGGGVQGGPDLAALLKQRTTCMHQYVWDGYIVTAAGERGRHRCVNCGSTTLSKIDAITGGL